MKDILIIFVLISSFSGSCLTAYATESIFFTPQELSSLHRNGEVLSDREGLTLNAISYIGERNWTIWINDDVLRPGSDHPLIEIARVEPWQVHYRWKGSNEYRVMGIGQTVRKGEGRS